MNGSSNGVDWRTISPRLLCGYGFVEADFDRTTAVLGTYRRTDQAVASVAGRTADAREAVAYLSEVRTVPDTRLVFVDRGRWTVVLTNARTGSDFNNHQYWAGKLLQARTIRVVDREARWWRRGDIRERLDYEARIFELHAEDGSPVRSITCADDGGRWVFETAGEPLPIEATFRYDAPRKRDRFTRPNLHELLTAVGPGPFGPSDLEGAPRFALIAEMVTNAAWRGRIDAQASTLEQADDPALSYYTRGMGWVRVMSTHYASVIADFERAVLINPGYEPKVRDHLRQARRLAASSRDIQ